MGKIHGCPRCGGEFTCTSGHWADRHPGAFVALLVLLGVPMGFTVVSVILAYPWFFAPAAMLALIVVCAVLINVGIRRRAALAARADWDHRQAMLREMHQPPPVPIRDRTAFPYQDLPLVRPRNPAPWHVVTQLPTRMFKGQQL